MPLCGFNQEMLKGLDYFHKGLVEHGIILRAKKKNQSWEKAIKNELSDMERFLQETHNIKDVETRELIEALTKYASAFYKLAGKEGIRNYDETIKFLNKFYFEIDNKYYSELEGQPEDMKKLALYLNNLGGKNAAKRI
ncbi:MAG: hypothetical protein Q8Q31_05075 [Nanoarchaeota archaeon]|nr:hypothetical protein [Nanoarchaeota archaeon]